MIDLALVLTWQPGGQSMGPEWEPEVPGPLHWIPRVPVPPGWSEDRESLLPPRGAWMHKKVPLEGFHILLTCGHRHLESGALLQIRFKEEPRAGHKLSARLGFQRERDRGRRSSIASAWTSSCARMRRLRLVLPCGGARRTPGSLAGGRRRE